MNWFSEDPQRADPSPAKAAVVTARRILHAQLGLPFAAAGGLLLIEALLIGAAGLWPLRAFVIIALWTVPTAFQISRVLMRRAEGRAHLASSRAWPLTGHSLENRVPGLHPGRPQAFAFGALVVVAYVLLTRYGMQDLAIRWGGVAILASQGLYPLALSTKLRMREHWVGVFYWPAAAYYLSRAATADWPAIYPVAIAGGMIVMGLLLHARYREIRESMAASDVPVAAVS